MVGLLVEGPLYTNCSKVGNNKKLSKATVSLIGKQNNVHWLWVKDPQLADVVDVDVVYNC